MDSFVPVPSFSMCVDLEYRCQTGYTSHLVVIHDDILHLAILHHKSVPLAPEVAKDLGGVKVKVQCLGELARGVGDEPKLSRIVSTRCLLA